MSRIRHQNLWIRDLQSCQSLVKRQSFHKPVRNTKRVRISVFLIIVEKNLLFRVAMFCVALRLLAPREMSRIISYRRRPKLSRPYHFLSVSTSHGDKGVPPKKRKWGVCKGLPLQVVQESPPSLPSRSSAASHRYRTSLLRLHITEKRAFSDIRK